MLNQRIQIPLTKWSRPDVTSVCLSVCRTCPAACGGCSTKILEDFTLNYSSSVLSQTTDRYWCMTFKRVRVFNDFFVFFCVFLMQGLLSFSIFGLDRHLIIIPFKKR